MLICPVWRYFFGGLVEEAGTGWGAAFPGPWYASIFVVGMNVATIFLMARRLQRLRAVLVRCIPWFSSLSSLLDRHNAAASTFDYWLPLNCGINVVSWSKMRVSFWEDSMATLASCGTFSSTLMATALVYISVLWVRLGGFLQLGDFGPSDVAMCLTSALLCIVFVAFAFDGAQLNNTLGSDAATLRKTAFTFMEYNVVTSNDTNDEHLAETRSKSSEVNEWIDIVVQHMSVTDEPLSLLGFELTSSFVSTLLGYITTVCLGLSHFCGIEVEEEVNTNLERFGLDRFFQLD